MPALIEVDNVAKRFGGVSALAGVTLRIEAGEVHCLAGENGSGKSTLIKILAGATRPDSGSISIGGRRLSGLRPAEAQQLGIQVIFQDLSLFPNLTVAENLAVGSDVSRLGFISWRKIDTVAQQALAKLEIQLDHRRRVETLSVAQKQLVAIGRALMQDARLVIMDEPTTALTDVEVEVLFGLIRRLQQQNVAVLFVSHKLREMLRISDRFSFLRNGRLVASGPAASFDQISIATHMTGHRPEPPPARARASLTAAPALDVRRLRGSGVHGLDFSLAVGEILGIAGLLGSGQTELALMLFGVDQPTGGELIIAGKPRQLRSIGEAIAAGIAYVPEDRLSEGLALEHSIAWNLAAATLPTLGNWAGLFSPAKLDRLSAERMNAMALSTRSPDVPVGTLSGGNQQRVVLGKWLATQPRILILNRPTVGVDIGSKRALHDQIRALAERGMAVLLISDDLLELSETCHRVLIMHEGRIMAQVAEEGWNEDTLADRLSALR